MISELKRQAVEAGARAIAILDTLLPGEWSSADDLILAAEYIGRLQERNGCTLEQIVRAAGVADTVAKMGEAWRSRAEVAPLGPEFVSDFFTAIVNEGIAKGRKEVPAPSWFDSHARFQVPPRNRVVKHWETEVVLDGQFIIPELVLES